MSVGEGKAATREAILDAAERLFAEQGVQAVSNRQISAAAGRGDTSVVADPTLREIVVEEANSPTLHGLDRCLPDLPPNVKRERTRIASHVIVHTCADRERVLADGLPLQSATWREAATVMIDALVGLLTAPVSGRSVDD